MGFIYFLSIITLFFTNVTTENLHEPEKVQRIVEGPVNTTVYVGDTVILKCHVENQVSFLPKFIINIFCRKELFNGFLKVLD